MKYEIIDQFLSQQECDEMIGMVTNRLRSSSTINPISGVTQVDDFRKSDQMFFKIAENRLIANIENRIAEYTNTDIDHGEAMQVVRYEPGGYFKPHHDDFDPNFPGNQPQIERGGQRRITFMMYLNDVEEGGETYFRDLDLYIKPMTGKAIVWWNLTEDRVRDVSANHEGRPLKSGLKYICTKWIRTKKFT